MNKQQLKEIRTKLGYKPDAFAKLLRVSRATYYKREAGTAPIKGDFALLVWYVERDLLTRGRVG